MIAVVGGVRGCGSAFLSLTLNDWSMQRAQLENRLEQQPGQQVVFVRYSPRHNVNFEWVYNHADLIHSKVIWARDLGTAHDQVLLRVLPDRVPWVIEADQANPQPIPYAQASYSPEPRIPSAAEPGDEPTVE